MDEASKGNLAWRHQMRYLVFVTPIGSISESDFYDFLALLRHHSTLPLENLTKPSNHAIELSPFPSFSWDRADTALTFEYQYKSVQDLQSVAEGEEAHVNLVHAWNRVIGIIGLVHYPTFMCQKDVTHGRLELIENSFHQIVEKIPYLDQLIFQKCFVLEYGFDLSRENRFLGERESNGNMNLVIFPMYQTLANGESTRSVHLQVVLDTLAVTVIIALGRLIHAVLSDIDSESSFTDDTRVGKRANISAPITFGASFSPSAMVSAAAAAITKRSGMTPSGVGQAEALTRGSKSRVSGIALFRTNIEPGFMKSEEPKANLKVKDIRQQCRWRKEKLIGDYAMMLSCYTDAKLHYERVIEHLRQEERHFSLPLDLLNSSGASHSSNDQSLAQSTGNALWLAAALEGHLHSLMCENENRFSSNILEQGSEALVHYSRACTPSLEIQLIQKMGRYLVFGIEDCPETSSEVHFWCKRLLLEVIQRGFLIFPVLSWRHQMVFLLHFEEMLSTINYNRHALMLLMEASDALLKQETHQLDSRKFHDILIRRLSTLLSSPGTKAPIWLDLRFHALRQLCALAMKARKWSLWLDFVHQLLWNLVEHDQRVPKGDTYHVEDENYARVPLLQSSWSSTITRGSNVECNLSNQHWPSLPRDPSHKQRVLMNFYRNRMICAVKALEIAGASAKVTSVNLFGVLSLFDRTSIYYQQVPSSLDASILMQGENLGSNVRKFIPFSLLASGTSPLSAMSSAAESISSALASTPRMLMSRTPRRQTITSLMRSPSSFDLGEVRKAFDDDDLEPLKLRTFSKEQAALGREKTEFMEERNSSYHIPSDPSVRGFDQSRWNLQSRRCITACQEEALRLLLEFSSSSKGWNFVPDTTRCILLLLCMQPKWENYRRYPILLGSDAIQRLQARVEKQQGRSIDQENAFLYSPFRDSQTNQALGTPFPSAKPLEGNAAGNKAVSDAQNRMKRMALEMELSKELQACAVYEVITFDFLLRNPLGVSLSISDATVCAQYSSRAENASEYEIYSTIDSAPDLECHPVSFTIPPYQDAFHCSLVFRPLLPGTIEIRGIRCEVANHKFQLSTEKILLHVLHPIPLVTMQLKSNQASDVTLPDTRDFSVSNGSGNQQLWLYECETKRFEILIENIGRHRVVDSQLLVEICELDQRSKQEKLLDAMIVWGGKEGNQAVQSIQSRRMWLKIERSGCRTTSVEIEQRISVFFDVGFMLSEPETQYSKSSRRKLSLKWKLVSTSMTRAFGDTITERYFRESNFSMVLHLLPSLALKSIWVENANMYTPSVPNDKATKAILSDSLCCYVIFQLWNPTESPFRVTAKALDPRYPIDSEVCVDIDRQCLRQITIQLALDSFAALLVENPLSPSWKDRFCELLQAQIKLDWHTRFQSSGHLEFQPDMLKQSCEQLAVQLLPAHVVMHLSCVPHQIHSSESKSLQTSNHTSFSFAFTPHLRQRPFSNSIAVNQFISLTLRLELKQLDLLWGILVQNEIELAVFIRQPEGPWLHNQSDGWKHFVLCGKTAVRVDAKSINGTQLLDLKILFLTQGTFEVFSRVRCFSSSKHDGCIDMYCRNPLMFHVQDP